MADSPFGEGLACISGRHVGERRDVVGWLPDSAHPDNGVNKKLLRLFSGAWKICLQSIVDHPDRVLNIVERVIDSRANHFGNDGLIAL